MFTNKEFSRPTDLQRRMKITPASSPREFYIQSMDGGYKDPSTLDPGDSFYTRPNVNRMFESSNLKPYIEPVDVMQMANNISRMVRKTDGVSPVPQSDRQSGGNMIRDMITGNLSREMIPQGIMDNPVVGTMMEGFDKMQEGYKKIEPFVPKIDPRNKTIEYDYSREVGPGTLDFGGSYGFGDDNYNLYGRFSMNFDEGGIVDTPQMQDMIKKELTDEQKDYLYDFMLDFMFKQKQREQQEMEGNMPRFNYFDMEV